MQLICNSCAWFNCKTGAHAFKVATEVRGQHDLIRPARADHNHCSLALPDPSEPPAQSHFSSEIVCVREGLCGCGALDYVLTPSYPSRSDGWKVNGGSGTNWLGASALGGWPPAILSKCVSLNFKCS